LCSRGEFDMMPCKLPPNVTTTDTGQGLDDRRRVEQYIKTFEEVLKKQKPDIEFTKEFRMSDQKYTSVFMDRGSEKLT